MKRFAEVQDAPVHLRDCQPMAESTGIETGFLLNASKKPHRDETVPVSEVQTPGAVFHFLHIQARNQCRPDVILARAGERAAPDRLYTL